MDDVKKIIACNDSERKRVTQDSLFLANVFYAHADHPMKPANFETLFPAMEDVFKKFFVQPDQHIERIALSHVSYIIAKNVDYKIGSAEGHIEILKDAIKDYVEFRLNVFREYEENFFEGRSYDRDALLMAVICDEFVKIPLESKWSKYQPVLDRALELWNNAAVVEENGLEDNEEPQPEIWCLSSINVMEQLEYMGSNLDKFPLSQVTDASKELFPIAGSIVKGDTILGLEIYKTLDRLDQMIQSRWPAATVTNLFSPDL